MMCHHKHTAVIAGCQIHHIEYVDFLFFHRKVASNYIEYVTYKLQKAILFGDTSFAFVKWE